MSMKKMNERKRTFLLMTIPVVALFFCFNTLPLLKGVMYSFTNFKGFGLMTGWSSELYGSVSGCKSGKFLLVHL